MNVRSYISITQRTPFNSGQIEPMKIDWSPEDHIQIQETNLS